MPRQPRRDPVPSGFVATLLIVVLGALVTLGAGCKDRAARVEPDPAALKAQQALIARRDAMLAARKQTQEERKRVQEELLQVVRSGGDAAEVQRKLDELDSQLEVQNNQLTDELSVMSSKLASIAMATDRTAGMASREAEVGSREDRLSQREDRMAQREAKVVEREREALRACAAVPTTTIVQQAPPAKGGNYSRKEIEGVLSRARSAMGRRGLLLSDLPAHAHGLEREATGAIADGEMGKAYLAATQLMATIEGVKIDGAFVNAKIGRLQSRITAKGGKLDEVTNKNMGAGIADVMQKWGDGDYARANAKLNQLSAALN